VAIVQGSVVLRKALLLVEWEVMTWSWKSFHALGITGDQFVKPDGNAGIDPATTVLFLSSTRDFQLTQM
jgi:hypothetical protein